MTIDFRNINVFPMFRLTIILSILIFTAAPVSTALAQEPQNTDVRVNILYAFELGFGSYDIGGLDVDVFKLPLSYTLSLDSSGRLKVKILSPVFYGRFRFRGTIPEGIRIKAEQHVISYIPGAELQYEILKNWYLKPFGQFGLIWSVSEKIRPRSLNAEIDDSMTYIYGVGLRSLYEYFWRRFKFSLGNAILWAQNAQFDGDDEVSFGVLENGVEALHPLGFTIKGYEPDISAFFIYYRFIPDAKFSRFLNSPKVVKNQYEISGTLGSSTPLKIGFIKNPRIGAGYRFGDLDAFIINFGFPF